MTNINTRRSLALLLSAMLIAVPVSSFASYSDDTGSPSAPSSSDAGPGSNSGSPSASSEGTDDYPGTDTGGQIIIIDCSPNDPCTSGTPIP